MAEERPPAGGVAPRRLRAVMHWRSLVSMLCGILLAGVISVASWIAMGHGPARAEQTVSLDIPAGTAGQLASGGAGPLSTAAVNLSDGDKLRIVNDDAVAHQVGGVAIQPGTVVELTLQQPGRQRFICSFHSSGALDVNVRNDTSPVTILWPSLLLGVPLGAVIAVAGAVFRGLDSR